MTSLMPRSQVLFPNMADWFDHTWPFGSDNLVRIEECEHEDKYVLRAELPGVDPEKDVRITVQGRLLTVAAEREAAHKDAQRSEFRYGSFSRSVTLPSGADVSGISAKYTDGILNVTVPIHHRAEDKPQKIEIEKN